MSICTSRTDTCLYMPSGWVVVHALPVSEYTDHMCRCLYRPYGWVSVQAVRVDVVRLSVCTGRTGVSVQTVGACICLMGVCTRRTGTFFYRSYRWVSVHTLPTSVYTDCMCACL